jgi:hypothetical protein
MRNIPEAKKRSATAQPSPADHAPLTPSVTAKRTTGTKPTSADGSTAERSMCAKGAPACELVVEVIEAFSWRVRKRPSGRL